MLEPALPTPEAIDAAAARIAEHVRITPVLELGTADLDATPQRGEPPRVVAKLEQLQHTGSFKVRGMLNRLLTADVPAAGAIIASGGNAGLAVAYGARRLGHVAEVFVPESSPAAKIDRLRAAGARVRVTGAYYAEAAEACAAHASETGAMVVHPYDQAAVVAGQGTLARELEAQVGRLDTVLVAVGGGGLMAGLACWLRDRVRLVAVEPERCPTLRAAVDAGAPVPVEVGGVAADSLGARQLGEIAFAAARRWVDEVVAVSDDAIVDAQRRLWETARVVAEPGGAAAAAALWSHGYRPGPGERVAVVVCGANTDPGSVA